MNLKYMYKKYLKYLYFPLIITRKIKLLEKIHSNLKKQL